MSEKLNIHEFEASQAKVEKLNVNTLESQNAVINALTADMIKLKSQIELLNDKLTIVKGSNEIMKISSEKTEIENNLYVKNELVSLPIGTVIAFAGKIIPDGWLICDGGSTNEHPKLRKIIGDYVPDLTNRFIMGLSIKDNLNLEWKDRYAGSFSVQLREENLPPHTHIFSYNTEYYQYKFSRYDKDSGFGKTTTTLDGYSEMNIRNSYSEKTAHNDNFKSLPIDITPPHFKLLYIIKAE